MLCDFAKKINKDPRFHLRILDGHCCECCIGHSLAICCNCSIDFDMPYMEKEEYAEEAKEDEA